jgi:hypothetical protein
LARPTLVGFSVEIQPTLSPAYAQSALNAGSKSAPGAKDPSHRARAFGIAQDLSARARFLSVTMFELQARANVLAPQPTVG